MACIGFSLCNAYIATIVWSPLFGAASEQPDSFMHLLRMVFFLTDAVSALVLKLISDTLAPRRIQFILIPLGLACSLPLALFLFLDNSSFLQSQWLAIAAWGFGGTAVAAICASWSYFLKPSSYHANLCNSATPFIISGVIFTAMQFLDPAAASVVTAALPFASATLWCTCHFHRKRQAHCANDAEFIHESFENSVKDVLGLPQSNFALFTIATGTIIGFTGALGTLKAYDDWVFLFIGLSHLTAGLATYALLGTNPVYPPRWFFVVLLPLATTCLYAASIAPSKPVVIICLLVLFTLSAIYHIIEQVFTSKFDIDRSKLAYSYFSRDRIINTCGMLIGWFIFYVDAFGPLSHRVDSFFLVSVLLFAAFFFITAPLISAKNSDSPPDSAKRPELYAFALSSIFAEYEISKREQEVYMLLLQGKRRQDIHEELHISTNTARSHIYNIYQKMGVHTQQELIELTERAIEAKA